MNYLSDQSDDYRALEGFIGSGKCGDLLHQARNSLFYVPEINAAFEPMAREILQNLAIEGEKIPILPNVLPTRFDNPYGYQIVSSLVEELKKTCEEIGINAEDFPPYACIPTGVINAYAAKIPGVERKFLLFDSQIFFFCNLLAKIIASSQPVIDTKGGIQTSVDITHVRKHLDENSDAANRMEQLLDASVYRSPSDAPAYLPKRDYVPQIQMLRDSMELFVVAHEFGHVYSGHLGSLLAAVPSGKDKLINEATAAQKMEYEADAIALILTIRSMSNRGYDLALSYIGPHMFFSGLILLDRYYELKHGPSSYAFSSEHPTSSDRKTMLNQIVESLVEEKDFRNAIGLQEAFSLIIEELWSRMEKGGKDGEA